MHLPKNFQWAAVLFNRIAILRLATNAMLQRIIAATKTKRIFNSFAI